jgi:FKBP-type peptidyl-prolyl cis-trans isomerase
MLPSLVRPVLVRRLAAAALAIAALAACRDVTVPLEDPAATSYAPSLNVNLSAPGVVRTASGLYYQDVAVGSGEVADSGKTIRVYYAGWLTNGRQFDGNRDDARPRDFVLGVGALIRGWDEGLRGMRVGGRRRLIVPPALGYGARTSGQIPAGSVLVFEIDLIGIAAPT